MHRPAQLAIGPEGAHLDRYPCRHLIDGCGQRQGPFVVLRYDIPVAIGLTRDCSHTRRDDKDWLPWRCMHTLYSFENLNSPNLPIGRQRVKSHRKAYGVGAKRGACADQRRRAEQARLDETTDCPQDGRTNWGHWKPQIWNGGRSATPAATARPAAFGEGLYSGTRY